MDRTEERFFACTEQKGNAVLAGYAGRGVCDLLVAAG